MILISILGTIGAAGTGGTGAGGSPMHIPVWEFPSQPTACTSNDESSLALRVQCNGTAGYLVRDSLNDYFSTHIRFEFSDGSIYKVMAPPRYIDVEFQGLGGDWSDWNGSHVAEFMEGVCPASFDMSYSKGTWITNDAGSRMLKGFYLSWYYDTPDWGISLATEYLCSCSFSRPSSSHSPYGTYEIDSVGCYDDNCSNTDTCYESQGATAIVSEH